MSNNPIILTRWFELKLCRMAELCLLLFFFSSLTLFLAGKWHHKIDSKIKISRCGKTNNLKRARRDRMKYFEKAQFVKELLSFHFFFLISRHFVNIFRNISTFQDAISPKAIVFFQNLFSHLFLSRHALSKLFICFATTWILNFESILWRFLA